VASTIEAQSLGTKYVLDAAAMDRIRGVLRAGGLLVYPTDTAYGLGADPFQPAAVDRLYEAKGRPRDEPVSMAVGDLAEVFHFGERTPFAEAFCTKNLPGPFTVVLHATRHAPRAIVSKGDGIAVRIPNHPIPRLLAKAYGPITATSANRHGQPSPETCAEARE
jgi:L-threonylcarbamoyladenylate synthase